MFHQFIVSRTKPHNQCNCQKSHFRDRRCLRKRVPHYLFTVLHDSYKELYLKIVARVDAASAHGGDMAGTASGNEILPHTPPESPLEDTDSEILPRYESDTPGLAHYDRDYSMIPFPSKSLKYCQTHPGRASDALQASRNTYLANMNSKGKEILETERSSRVLWVEQIGWR